MALLDRSIIRLSLFLCGTLMLFSIRAQDGVGGCPSGQIPYSGSDVTSCGPIPNGYDQQTTLPQRSHPQWTSSWGAIATDASKGILSGVTDRLSREDAQKMAFDDCKIKGGTQCKLQVVYDNQCAVMILGDKVFNVANAVTLDKATKLGMQKCNAESTNCHVYYSACSLPKIIN